MKNKRNHRSVPYRVAYLVSHPIQYQAPLLRLISVQEDIDLTVFFISDFSTRAYVDDGFNKPVAWDVPLLDGYKSIFLPLRGDKKGSALRSWSYGIRKQLQRGKFDVLWLHGYAHPTNLRAFIEAKRLGLKVMIRSESQAASASRSPLNTWFKEVSLKYIFSAADAFLVIGSLNKAYYQKYGAPSEKIFFVPYAVDNEFFQMRCLDANTKRDSFRKSLGLTIGRPVILFASKFTARKRVLDVIDAYIKLASGGAAEPEAYLILVGDGEQRAEAEDKAARTGWSSIRFVGFQNQTELPRFYDLCDVFALVSEREPWGLVINEVMNAGKTIIVSDQVGSAVDLVHDGENGFIVATGDIESLTNQLRLLIENPNITQLMGKRSLEIINCWNLHEDIDGLRRAIMFLCN